MNAHTLPLVDPMFVRRITPTDRMSWLGGGVLILNDFDVEDVGLVTARFTFDADVIEVSRRIYQLTTLLMMDERPTLALCVFSSRRFRTGREGDTITYVDDEPFLYIGNPVRVLKEVEGIHVMRSPEYLIRSGMELELEDAELDEPDRPADA